MKTKLLSVLTAILSVFAAAAFAEPARRIDISIQGYTGSEVLSDFPVLVRLSEEIPGFSYAECGEGGCDIRFKSEASDEAFLYHDIDTWNTNGVSLIWVRLDELSASSSFCMTYMESLAAPSEEFRASTWQGAPYVGVWHMNEASGNVRDASGHGFDMTPHGSLAEESVAIVDSSVPSGIGRQSVASAVSGKRACLLIPNYDDVWMPEGWHEGDAEYTKIGGTFTFSAWVRPYSNVFKDHVNPRLCSRKTHWNDDKSGWEVEFSGNDTRMQLAGSTADKRAPVDTKASLIDKWNHLAVVYNGAKVSLYVNGVLIAVDQALSAAPTDNGRSLSLGHFATENGNIANFRGIYDEVRLIDEVISADWAMADYAQLADAEFLSYGPVLSLAGEGYEIVSPSVVSTDQSSAELELVVIGVDESRSASFVVRYGAAASALSREIVVSSSLATSERRLTAVLPGLVPGGRYFAKAVVVDNTTGEDICDTEVVSFTTLGGVNIAGESGVWQTVFTNALSEWKRDIWSLPVGTNWLHYSDNAEAADARIRRRELTVISPYTTPNVKYTSEVWGTDSAFGGKVYMLNFNYNQYAYAGYIHMEVGKKYKFRANYDDSKMVKVRCPVTGEETVLFDQPNHGTEGINKVAFEPKVTGPHYIEMRFADGVGSRGGTYSGNNYFNSNNFGISDDDGATWSYGCDGGEGLLFSTGEATARIKEIVEGGTVKSFTLSVDSPKTNDWQVYLVCGDELGSRNPASWLHGSDVATAVLTAGETELTVALPEGVAFGDSGYRVAAVYLEDLRDDEVKNRSWTAPLYAADYSETALSALHTSVTDENVIEVSG